MSKLYHSISEVSNILGLKQYVLRYWETEFPSIKPDKNRAGNRVYKKKDIDNFKIIQKLLHEKKYTIKGARQYLKDNGKKANDLGSTSSRKIIKSSAKNIDALMKVKSGLDDILKTINKYK
tara:strand:- start:202 stop:564 length:363 start_codon:yes stop_codon:yes gene_type:complete